MLIYFCSIQKRAKNFIHFLSLIERNGVKQQKGLYCVIKNKNKYTENTVNLFLYNNKIMFYRIGIYFQLNLIAYIGSYNLYKDIQCGIGNETKER